MLQAAALGAVLGAAYATYTLWDGYKSDKVKESVLKRNTSLGFLGRVAKSILQKAGGEKDKPASAKLLEHLQRHHVSACPLACISPT